MKKLVVRLELEDGKAKKKALKTVSTLKGIDVITVDMKEKKMMVIGTVDPVHVVTKLRKYWQTNIITLGPAKEPEKKEEAKPAAAAAGEEGKKEEGGQKEDQKAEEGNGKKEEGKKEEGKKEEGKKEDEPAKKQPLQPQLQPQPNPEHMMEQIRARQQYNNPYFGHYPYMANPYMMNQHYPQMHPPTYYVRSVEENPNGCAIF